MVFDTFVDELGERKERARRNECGRLERRGMGVFVNVGLWDMSSELGIAVAFSSWLLVLLRKT